MFRHRKSRHSRSRTPLGVSQYTQQHTIDVGDVAGHQIRIFEVHTVFTAEKPGPKYDGVAVKEGWTRAATDYIEGSGHGNGYSVTVLENGDKIFGRYEVVKQMTVSSDGSKLAKAAYVVTFTGGTGKFKGIRGFSKGSVFSDFKTLSDAVSETEYWIEN